MVDKYKILDSGERSEFPTGAVRDIQEGKGRFDLLPMWALIALAKHYEAGCVKYGDRNWEKGIPISRYMDSGIRHAIKHILGETDEPHLVAACWNFMCAIDTLERIKLGLLPKELDDLPYPLKKADSIMLKALEVEDLDMSVFGQEDSDRTLEDNAGFIVDLHYHESPKSPSDIIRERILKGKGPVTVDLGDMALKELNEKGEIDYIGP